MVGWSGWWFVQVAERIPSWWLSFNPFEKYARQIGNHFPRDRGENKKSLSCHQPDAWSCWMIPKLEDAS